MAVSRYDQRKNCEEAEANAIGTEYLRADLLPADDAAKARELLRTYVNQRIMFYLGDKHTGQASVDHVKVQTELWASVVRVRAQALIGLGFLCANVVPIRGAQNDSRLRKSIDGWSIAGSSADKPEGCWCRTDIR